MKKQKIIIFGNHEFAKMMAEYIQKFTNDEVCGFTVNKEYIKDSKILELPVIEFENIEKKFDKTKYKFLITLGYNRMNSLRENIFGKVKEKGYEITSFIHPTALINTEEIGEGNIFLENVFIGPYSKIGDGNIFWNGVNISHNATIENYNYFSPSTTFAGNVKVSNNCFLGANCTVKNGVNISNKTLIGAGCYLSKDTLNDEVYVPERAVKLDKNSSQIKLI